MRYTKDENQEQHLNKTVNLINWYYYVTKLTHWQVDEDQNTRKSQRQMYLLVGGKGKAELPIVHRIGCNYQLFL